VADIEMWPKSTLLVADIVVRPQNIDEHLSFSDQMSALSKSCYHHIHSLRRIHPYLDLPLASIGGCEGEGGQTTPKESEKMTTVTVVKMF